MSDYLTYRGKCKELSEQFVKENPEWSLVSGWYFCPFWMTNEEHWWCEKDGQIHDPSVWQFPSAPSKDSFPAVGNGSYEKFNGLYPCRNCGEEVDIEVAENHNGCCTYECYGDMIGFNFETQRFD